MEKEKKGIKGTIPLPFLHPYNSEELESEPPRQFKMEKM